MTIISSIFILPNSAEDVVCAANVYVNEHLELKPIEGTRLEAVQRLRRADMTDIQLVDARP